MNLIIFDIDGTLTQTNDVDSKCFTRAIKETLGIKDLNTEWSDYQHSTDSGLLNEIYAFFLQKTPSDDDINKIRDAFVEHLKQEWITDKNLYAPVLGAENIFQEISTLTNWHIAIATGGWKKSALFKLESAAIPHEELPKAFADDNVDRTEIIKTAIKNSEFLHGINQYKHIVYVGDKHWDEQAATSLNIGFVGVGNEFTKRHLSKHLFVKDYQDNSMLFNYLENI